MKQLDSKRMYSFKTGEIKFESEEEIPWTLDGEFGGAHKEITVKDKKQAVQIKVTQRWRQVYQWIPKK